MNRFFVNKDESGRIILSGEDYKHAKKVLRLDIKDKIYVVLDNKEYIGMISEDRDSSFVLEITKATEVSREPDVCIHIYQSMPKSSKMDYIIQKNVELGVKKLTPIISNRSLIKIKNHKKEKKKLERWIKISEEAAKQSMRNTIPEINGILSFDEMIKELKESIQENDVEVIVPYENENIKSTKDLDYKKKKFSVVIGPEGGFEESEIDKLIDIGAVPITLGPRILRSETAALALSTVILHETNNMRREL